MSDQVLSEREVIAHHEAAHAVLALELGVELLEVGIELNRVDATGGVGNVGCRLFVTDLTYVVPSDLEAEQRRLAGVIDCNGTVLAAGAASDAKLRNEAPWTALEKQQADFKHMRELLQMAQLATTPELTEERLRSQLELAVEALDDAMVWAAVEAVAAEVLKHGQMSGSQIEGMAKAMLEADRSSADGPGK